VARSWRRITIAARSFARRALLTADGPVILADTLGPAVLVEEITENA
jgi:hypothetical protein